MTLYTYLLLVFTLSTYDRRRDKLKYFSASLYRSGSSTIILIPRARPVAGLSI